MIFRLLDWAFLVSVSHHPIYPLSTHFYVHNPSKCSILLCNCYSSIYSACRRFMSNRWTVAYLRSSRCFEMLPLPSYVGRLVSLNQRSRGSPSNSARDCSPLGVRARLATPRAGPSSIWAIACRSTRSTRRRELNGSPSFTQSHQMGTTSSRSSRTSGARSIPTSPIG